MSFMRDGHPLRWFEGTTDAYIWEDLYGRIEDYGGLRQMTDASFCELVGRFVDRSLREDGYPDPASVGCVSLADDFHLRLVTELARRTGCTGLQLAASRRDPGDDLRALSDPAIVEVVRLMIERHLTLGTAEPRTYDRAAGVPVTVQAEPDLGFVRRVVASLARRLELVV